MIKSLTASNGGQIHVFTNEPGMGDPDTVNIITEMVTPVEMTVEEAQQLAQNLSDVINATQE